MEVLTMNNLREVNNDILKDWLNFREEDLCSLTCDEDRKHHSFLDENFMNYIDYWNEKYYRNGFCDGVQLIIGCESNNIPF